MSIRKMRLVHMHGMLVNTLMKVILRVSSVLFVVGNFQAMIMTATINILKDCTVW